MDPRRRVRAGAFVMEDQDRLEDRANRLVRMIRSLPSEKASPIMKLLTEHEAEVATINRVKRWLTAIFCFVSGCVFTKFVEWLVR